MAQFSKVILLLLIGVATAAAFLSWPTFESAPRARRTRGAIDDAAREINDFTLRYTRKTFDGTTISKRLCAADAAGDCNTLDYGEFLATQALVGICLAVFTLLVLIVFCVGRCCCCCIENGCWGGKKPSKGIICTDEDKFEGYSKVNVCVVLFLTLTATVLVAILCIVAFVGQGYTSNGLGDFVDNTLDITDGLIVDVTTIRDTAQGLDYSTGVTEQISGALSDAEDVQSQARKVADRINEGDKIRVIIGFILIAIFLLVAVVGFFFAIFKCHRSMNILGILAMLCSILVFLIFAVATAGAFVTADTCRELYAMPTPGYDGVFTAIIEPCLESSSFSSLLQTLVNAKNSAVQEMCEDYDNLCAAADGQCGTCSDTTLNTLNSTIIHDTLPCGAPECTQPCVDGRCYDNEITIADCARSCRNSNLRNQATQATDAIDQAAAYSRLIELGTALVECTYIYDLAGPGSEPLCRDFLGGLYYLWIAMLIMGAAFWFAFVMFILGAKRFNSDYKKRSKENPFAGKELKDTPIPKM